VLFADKHIAGDGHKCDSLTEKIIDDWLANKGIKHKRSVPYGHNTRFTCDFVIGDYFIEFLGLENNHKHYTEVAKEKRKLAKKHNINLIELRPNQVLPRIKLDEALGFLLEKAS